MPDLSRLIDHWGYSGVFLAVVLGNIGVPIPEETVLVLAGYAAARGVLHLPTLLMVAVVSAMLGDNVGYWLGRRYGRGAIDRYGHLALITPERLQKISAFMHRHGALAIFLARFLPGLRFLAGPLAGATGTPPLTFMLANALGALVYAPYAVGLGYGIGWTFGDAIERLFTRRVDHVIVGIVVAATLVLLALRLLRARRSSRSNLATP